MFDSGTVTNHCGRNGTGQMHGVSQGGTTPHPPCTADAGRAFVACAPRVDVGLTLCHRVLCALMTNVDLENI
eukprot:4359778-Amphidinium_carterae.1